MAGPGKLCRAIMEHRNKDSSYNLCRIPLQKAKRVFKDS